MTNPLPNPLAHWLTSSQDFISVETLMQQWLMHPHYGYYTQQPAIGANADFITAPEVSQFFGEVIGAFLASQWEQANQPQHVCLIEFGPGRGTLMNDILRTFKHRPALYQSTRVYLVEINPFLKQQQQRLLSQHHPSCSLHWVTDLNAIPKEGFNLMVANEFCDALPIQQWVWQQGAWHERGVIWKNQQLNWTSRLADVPLLEDLPDNPPQEGDIFETSPITQGWFCQLLHRLKSQGGAALVIDYGHLKPRYGDTLQSIAAHQKLPLTEAPIGKADLTAHVDFSRLYTLTHAAGLPVTLYTTQGDFLRHFGILERAQRFSQATVHQDLERLLSPHQMGTLFKVIGVICPKPLSPPLL